MMFCTPTPAKRHSPTPSDRHVPNSLLPSTQTQDSSLLQSRFFFFFSDRFCMLNKTRLERAGSFKKHSPPTSLAPTPESVAMCGCCQKPMSFHHNHHHCHLSLNREGRWGSTEDFTTSFLHFSLFSTALWDLAKSRPVHSLMLSSRLILCLPCLLPLFTVPCKQDGFG